VAPLFVWELTRSESGLTGDQDLGLYESKTKAKKGAQTDTDEWRAQPGNAYSTAKLPWQDGNGFSRAIHPDNYRTYWIQKRKVVH
jgi:hypothetical protein